MMPEKASTSSPKTLDTFVYVPLESPSHIRLLVLHPGDEPDAICCSLSQTSLDQTNHIYEALSYVWGDIESSVPIICEGRSLLMTPSLHSALRRLRFTEKKRILWVDAICINQKDDAEKSVQVGLMGCIYQNAGLVIADLGERPEDWEVVKHIWDAHLAFAERHGDTKARFEVTQENYEKEGFPDPKDVDSWAA